MNLNKKIQEELTQFSGKTFYNSEGVTIWIEQAMKRIAKATTDALMVEKMVTKKGEYETTATNIEKFGFNQAVQDQEEKRKQWESK